MKNRKKMKKMKIKKVKNWKHKHVYLDFENDILEFKRKISENVIFFREKFFRAESGIRRLDGLAVAVAHRHDEGSARIGPA